ncbi:MAG TPA: hypothetical protein VGN02_00415 [Paenibacillus sp.]|jgi:beta-glucosidase
MKCDIQALIAEMTLEEKASMCSGRDFWLLKRPKQNGDIFQPCKNA